MHIIVVGDVDSAQQHLRSHQILDATQANLKRVVFVIAFAPLSAPDMRFLHSARNAREGSWIGKPEIISVGDALPVTIADRCFHTTAEWKAYMERYAPRYYSPPAPPRLVPDDEWEPRPYDDLSDHEGAAAGYGTDGSEV